MYGRKKVEEKGIAERIAKNSLMRGFTSVTDYFLIQSLCQSSVNSFTF